MNENHYIIITHTPAETSEVCAALASDSWAGKVEWFAHPATYERGHAIGCKRSAVSVAQLQHAASLAYRARRVAN